MYLTALYPLPFYRNLTAERFCTCLAHIPLGLLQGRQREHDPEEDQTEQVPISARVPVVVGVEEALEVAHGAVGTKPSIRKYDVGTIQR